MLAGLPGAKFSRTLLMAFGLAAAAAGAHASTVAAPVFNPAAGTFTNVQMVTITTTTSGASIRYTLDGSTPSSTAGTLYSGPVAIVTTKTLKAIGFETGFTSSSVTSGTYTINATTLQAESLSPVGTGATVSTTTDTNASGGKIEFLNATAASQTMTLTSPSVAAGTYQVQFHYQTATTRGQHTVKIDGAQIGSTIDQFASTSAYTTATLGNVTFGTTGTHSIVLAVTGKNSSSSKFTITADSFILTPALPLPVISSALSATGQVGTAFSYQITASNSPMSFNATGLPAGLSVSTTTGLISGTPTATGTSNVTISAINAGGTGSATLVLTVNPAKPVITSATTATGQVGVAFSYQITASNSPTSFSATGLPAGLSVSTTTGLISGTPTTVATSSVTISAINAGGTGSATLVLTVNPAKPAITSATTASGQTGVAFSYQITASNSPTSFAASPLPAGLSVSTSTGLISGTPTATGTTNVSLTATNAGGTSPAVTLVITITLGKPVITSAATAAGQVGVAFSYQITASNSPTSFSATGLPAGLSVSTTTGLISGTPTAAATSSVTLNATNATGTGTKTLTLTVNPPKPAITSATTATGQVGTAFSYQITASNNPTSFAASPLPAGLSVSTTTGLISGTPTTVGTTNVSLTATNAGGTSPAVTLAITTTASAAAPVFSPMPGTFTSAQSVTITSTTSGASLAYTTDGSTPTESGGSVTHGTLYSTPVSISATTTLKAIAFKTGFTDSAVSSGTYTINAPISLSGLCLWLNADLGVATDSNGLVTTWSDQSGLGHGAFQTQFHSPQPVLGAMNGHAVVRFNGGNDALLLPNVMQDPNNPQQQAGAGEIFIVNRLADLSSNNNGLCQFGNGGGTAYNYANNQVWDDFGTENQDSFNLANPVVLTQSHIYDSSVGADGTSILRFNGAISRNLAGQTVDFTQTPLLGSDWFGEHYTGDIAEVIVYNRVLTSAERDSVYQYLAAKYAPPSIVVPGTPVLNVYTVSPTQADLSWSAANAAGQHTVTTIERQTGSGGFVQIAQLNDGFSYTDTGLSTGQSYTYRVKLASYAGTSSYSNAVAITPPAAGLPTAGLRLWLRSTAGVTTADSTGLVSTWVNQSAPGSDATQFSPIYQPQLVANQVNGLPVVRFSGNQMFDLPDLMSGAGAGEIIAVLKVVDKTLGGYQDTNNKLWNFNQNGTGYGKNQPGDTIYYQYNTFGLDNADMGTDIPVSLVSNYHIFDTSSSSALCAEYYNGTLYHSIAGQAITFNSQPNLGAGVFVGDFAEIIIYDHALTPADRDAVNAYLAVKYAPPGIAVPGTPALNACAISPTQADLSWSAPNTVGQHIVATIERQTGGGNFTQIAQLSDTFSYTDAGLTAGQGYSYRVKLASYVGTSPYSNTVAVTPIAISLPATGLRLWLRSTVGVTADSDGLVGTWADQSSQVPTNNATQTSVSNQPVLVTSATDSTLPNGLPVIHFTADQQASLNLLTNPMAGASGGEAFAIVRRSATSDIVGLWAFGTFQYGSRYPETNNQITDDFASNNWDPNGTGPAPTDLTNFKIYNVGGDNTTWFLNFDGSPHYSRVGNQVGFTDTPTIGDGRGAYFDGDVAEIIIYDHVLTPADRFTVNSYLAAKYAIAVAAPVISPAGGSFTSAQTVTITSATTGASIRYTTDGSTPSETNGTIYSGPVNISVTTVLKAVAYATGFTDSAVASGTYTMHAIAPAFSPAAGTYIGTQAVTITSATGGATIRYTTDGSTPTETNGTVYSGPVSINATATLQAIAYKAGFFADSTVTSGTYTIKAIAPVFNPATGTYANAQTVAITSATGGATIRYTTDGSTPTETHGMVYSTPVSISGTATLQAVAYENGLADSNVASAVYTLQAAAPAFSPAPGAFTAAQTVAITSTTSGATIRYTTDGSTPNSTTGTVYSGPVTISVTTVLKAIAYEAGFTSSGVTTGTYTMNAIAPVFSPAAGTYNNAQSVTITSATGGALIRYTTDGVTMPNATTGTLYSGPVNITGTTTLQAVAYEAGFTNSSVASAVYTLQAAAPGFSPAAGTYNNAQAVTITSATSGALIRYTTDGSAPTETNGTLYSGVVTITGTTPLQAIAYKAGYTDSSVASAVYTLQAAAPGFSPAGGTYGNAQAVTITSATSGASIRYTTDGSTPTSSSGTIYSGAVTISGTATLKAVAYKAGYTDSGVSSAVYTLQAVAPVFNPVAGTYSNALAVSLTSATGGVLIRYTTDGSTPTETHGTIYSGPVNLAGTTTLKAVAYESGYTDSGVSSAVYTLQAAAPVFGSAPGNAVTITSATSGTTIRYTTDGSTPTETHGTVYSGPVGISTATTLKAVAYESGFTDSLVSSVNIGIPTITITTPANGSTISN